MYLLNEKDSRILNLGKKRDLERSIRELAKSYGVEAGLVRDGKHEIWDCEGLMIPIPRHTEINDHTAKHILKSLALHLEELQNDA